MIIENLVKIYFFYIILHWIREECCLTNIKKTGYINLLKFFINF